MQVIYFLLGVIFPTHCLGFIPYWPSPNVYVPLQSRKNIFDNFFHKKTGNLRSQTTQLRNQDTLLQMQIDRNNILQNNKNDEQDINIKNNEEAAKAAGEAAAVDALSSVICMVNSIKLYLVLTKFILFQMFVL